MSAAARAEAGPGHRQVFVPLVAGLAALSWLALWWLGTSPAGAWLDHHEAAAGGLAVFTVAVAGWVLMTTAMMLPTTLPLVRLFARVTAAKRDQAVLVGLLLGGYVAVWTGFGVAALLGDRGLHALVERVAWLHDRSWSVTAGTLAVAGAYQFSALKYRCLDQCRSPFMFVAQRWTGRDERYRAFRIGVDHGVFCVGCCWSLMLVLFAIGMSNPAWMLGAGAVMAVEKNMAWGRRLSAPLGAAFAVAALAVVVSNLS